VYVQVRFLRSIRNIASVGAAVAVLTVLAASSASAAETKTFSALKTCSGLLATVPLTQTCLISPSSLKILVGGTVHYTDIVFYNDTGTAVPRSLATYLSSPVTFTAVDRRESTATGRCTFYIRGSKAGTGHCEYWSGTAKLEGFHAMMAVGTVSAVLKEFSLTGTYWFDRDHHGDDENGGDSNGGD
jgi:hypothetical protein